MWMTQFVVAVDSGPRPGGLVEQAEKVMRHTGKGVAVRKSSEVTT